MSDRYFVTVVDGWVVSARQGYGYSRAGLTAQVHDRSYNGKLVAEWRSEEVTRKPSVTNEMRRALAVGYAHLEARRLNGLEKLGLTDRAERV